MKLAGESEPRFAGLHSVLFRLMLVFVVLVLPIFVGGMYISGRGLKVVDEQIRHSLKQQMDFKVKQLELEVGAAKRKIEQLSQSHAARRLSGAFGMMSGYDKLAALNTLLDEMLTIQSDSLFVEQVVLYMPKPGLKLLAPRVSNNQQQIGPIDAERFEQLLELSARHIERVVFWHGGLVYTLQNPLPYALSMGSQPRLLFQLSFNMTAINEFLSPILSDSGSAHLLVDAQGAVWRPAPDLPSQLMTEVSKMGSGVRTLRANGEEYYVMRQPVLQLNADLVVWARQAPVFLEITRFQTLLYVLVGLYLLAIGLYLLFAYHSVHLPLRLISGAFDRLARGEMDFQVEYRGLTEFHFLTRRFNQMLAKLKTTLEQLYRQQILMQQAELKQLQAQINPHFLYNSFFMLENMISVDDTQTAAAFSRLLGRYFRYLTRDGRSRVALSEELSHARSYLDIQRMRFGDRLELRFLKPAQGLGDPQVPRLFLQPLMENAFVHSLEKCPAGGWLEVRVSARAAGLLVEVENNSVPDAEALCARLNALLNSTGEGGEVSALNNVHRRLRLCGCAGLELSAVPPDRLVVSVELNTDGQGGEQA